MRLPFMFCGALVALPLTACGQQTATGGDTPDLPPSEPTSLTCPSGYSDLMDARFDGSVYPTREGVVKHFLEMSDDTSAKYVISKDGKTAWILREDGTAQDRVWLLRRHNGFFFRKAESC